METKKKFDHLNSPEGSLYLLALGYQGWLKWNENKRIDKEKKIDQSNES